MRRLLAFVLAGLVLLQSLGREALVLDFALNQARITQQYCVNKTRPALHCDGKCYLAKKLRRAAERDSKAPESAWAKVKFEALSPARVLVQAAPAWSAGPARYPAQPRVTLAVGEGAGIFRPPVFRS